MFLRFVVLCWLIFGFSASAWSQKDNGTSLSNWRTKTFLSISDTLILDTLTVIPETVELTDLSNNSAIPSTYYQVNNNFLTWEIKTNLPKGIRVKYRVMPYQLSTIYSHKDTSWIGYEDFSDYVIPYEYNPYNNGPEVFDFEGLKYSGSFARGISFGNNQDLVLNSSFNLQMAGNIGDDIEILAAISDNNIPLQPEGNTQQLQEFDQVFIQLKRHKSTLIAGDYQLQKPKGYFLNYLRKLQGASFSTEVPFEQYGNLKAKASGAVSRGTFARNAFNGSEGNQGPYKLVGNVGERFIIILAGTEKVFIDGIQLVRGSENDYVIDYNTGEVTFTNNQLITKDKRIVIDFTYSVNTFPRTLYGANLEYSLGKLDVHFNLFSEQDAKNQYAQNELSVFQRQQFQDLGDQAQDAFFSGVETLEEFDIDRPMYKMVDTLVNGILYDSVYVQTFNQDSAQYTLQFSNVGLGNGNYIRETSSVNFRVYRWVSPDSNGMPQGDFEPVVKLTAPNQQQMYSLGATYEISKNAKIFTEVALSNSDVNTLSDLDEQDNQGLGAKASYEQKIILDKEKDPNLGLQLLGKVDYEFVHENFREFQNYRSIEFRRDWNTIDAVQANEHLTNASLSLQKKEVGFIKYGISNFIRENNYTGFKHEASSRFTRKGFDLKASLSYLTTEATEVDSRFFRPRVDISKTFKKLNGFKVGIYGEREKNSQYISDTDSLQANSFFYDLAKAYISTGENKSYQIGASYSKRLDYEDQANAFKKATSADDFNINGFWKAKKSSTLRWNMTYRNLVINDSTLTTQDPQATYLGRVEYLLNVKKGLIRANTVYELGSGQQQKIEYTYLEVNPGEGVYTWIDRNEDGIKQLDEFETAVFSDQADHIRVSTFSDEFIRSNNLKFSQSFGFNPIRIWKNEKGFKGFVAKFSTNSTFQISRRTIEDESIFPWNPFEFNLPDSSLVSINTNLRNSLFFNRINPKYGLELSFSNNRNKVALTTGYEDRRRSEQALKARWNISKKIGTNLTASRGTRDNDSEFFNNKDFALQFYTVEPQLTLIFNKNFRTILNYTYRNSKNTIGDLETTLNHDMSAEMTYNKISKTEIRLKLSYVDVDYTGMPGTPVEFAMLQGLQNGKNYLWNLTLERRLAQNILLNLSYEGRKTGEARMIHVGRASVRATF